MTRKIQKNVYLLCFAFCYCAFEAFGIDDFKSKAVLKMEKYNHDFGVVKRGQKIATKFRFENVGTGPLKIHGVHSACGCAVAEYKQDKIYAPGEEGEIEIKFDTSNFKGKIKKIVSLIFNETPPLTINLNLSVLIEEEIYAYPPLVDFHDALAAEGAIQEVSIRTLSKDVQVQAAKCNSELLTCELTPRGEREWRLKVSLRKNLRSGFLKDTIVVENNSQFLKELPVWVRGNIKGSFEIAPAYLEFGSIAKNEASSRKIQIHKIADQQIVSARAELNINGMKASPSDVDQMVQVKLPGGAEKDAQVQVDLKNLVNDLGSVHGKIFLATSDPNQKQVTVDFYAFFR